MEEEVLIAQGRLIWPHCESPSSLRIITHQEPCCVSVLGLCGTEQGRACLHSASQKVALKGKASSYHALLLMASKLTHSSRYPRKSCSRRKALRPWAHTCSYVHNPTCPAAFNLQLLKGIWRKILSSKAELQADSIKQWDARFQPGCSTRSCCCCVNPEWLLVWLLQWRVALRGHLSHWENSMLSLPGVVILTGCKSTPFSTPKFPHSSLSWGFAGWFLTSSTRLSNWNFEQNQGESTQLLKDTLKTYPVQ